MNTIDFNRPVKFIKPFAGEENLIYQVMTYNESTGKCILQLIDTPATGVNPDSVPPESASIEDLENV